MKNRLKGFTLLESILYIGLFSVILLIVVNFMLTTQEANLRTETREGLHKHSRFITQHINHTFESADSVDELNSTFDSDTGKLTVVINGVNKTYDLQTYNLYYDGIPISPSDIIVGRFNITPVYEELEITAVRIAITLTDKKDNTLTEEINLLSTFR